MGVVKPLPYGRQSIDEEDIRAVVAALQDDWLTQGPAVARFETALTTTNLLWSFVGVTLGTVIGIGRLSGNWLVRNFARLYVETLRNIPLLLIIIFSYLGLALTAFPRIDDAWQPLDLAVISNRGVVVPWFDGGPWGLLLGIAITVLIAWLVMRWRTAVNERSGEPAHASWWMFATVIGGLALTWLLAGSEVTVPELDGRTVTGGIRLSPEYFAILFALVIYTASHIAEIVRGSIQAVHRGQS